MTALWAASATGHAATVEELLVAEADVHGKIRGSMDYNSLNYLLVRFTLNFSTATVAGYGPDGIARQLRMPSCLRDCRQNGLCRALFRDLIWLCSETVLHLASREGHTAIVKLLVGARADVHCLDSKGYGSCLRRLSEAS
jgi:hypothetical protein